MQMQLEQMSSALLWYRGFLGRMVHGVCSFAREHPEAVVAVVSGVVGGVILGRAGSGRRRA